MNQTQTQNLSKSASIYTDGSCINACRTGAWAFIHLLSDGTYYSESGYEYDVTHNRMEVMAVLKALTYIATKSKLVTIYTDSNLVHNAISGGRLRLWMSKGFKTQKGERAHADLWIEITKILDQLDVITVHVPSHGTDTNNIIVDKLARQTARRAANQKHIDRAFSSST